MTSTLKLAAALLCLSFTACGSATLVKTSTLGGHIELQGGYMPAMGEARLLMGEHCEGRYQVVEHGNQVDFRCRDQVSALARR